MTYLRRKILWQHVFIPKGTSLTDCVYHEKYLTNLYISQKGKYNIFQFNISKIPEKNYEFVLETGQSITQAMSGHLKNSMILFGSRIHVLCTTKCTLSGSIVAEINKNLKVHFAG